MQRLIIEIFRRFPRWVPTLTVAAIIAYLTLARFDMDPGNVPQVPHLDKVVHFIMFGGLAWTAALDYCVRKPEACLRAVNLGRLVVICAVASSVAGAAVEMAQGMMHMGRSADVMDWVADTAGAAIGAWISWKMLRSLLWG